MNDASGTARDQLKAIVQRVERIEAEIKDLNDDKSEIYKEARANGFDVKTIKKVISKRKIDVLEREEQDAMFDTYWNAIHGSGLVHAHARENIEKFDSETGEILETNPRLIKQVVDGMQTEAGRAALIAAVDILIEQEEAEEDQPEAATQSPRKAAEAASERTAVQVEADVSAEATIEGQPSVTVATSAESAGEAYCLGTGLPTNSPSDDDAIAEVNGSAGLENVVDVEPSSSDPIASASQGEAEAPSLEGVNPVDEGGLDANAGGEDALIDENCDQPSNTVGERINVSPADGITYETAPKVGMKYLSYAHCFPELTKAEYQCLAGDITLNGVLEPIVRMGDIIVDGWNRYNAARSLGIEYPVREYDGDDVLLDVIRWQRAARNWTPQQERKIASSLSKVVPHRSNDIWQAFDQEPALQKEEVAA